MNGITAFSGVGGGIADDRIDRATAETARE